jgi:hypothetical protein
MTIQEELAAVARGVQDQVGAQLKPEMRSLVLIAAPTGEFTIAHDLERERLIKLLKRALASAEGGGKSSSGILWLPPGVRA